MNNEKEIEFMTKKEKLVINGDGIVFARYHYDWEQIGHNVKVIEVRNFTLVGEGHLEDLWSRLKFWIVCMLYRKHFPKNGRATLISTHYKKEK